MQNTSIERILAKLALLIAPLAMADTYPGDDCCRLYKDRYYAGEAQDFCFDEVAYGQYGVQPHDLDAYGFKNRASSWWCGKNVAYDFCNDGENTCRMSGAGNGRSPKMGYEDGVDVLKLSRYDAAERGAVTLFTDGDCMNTFGRFQVPAAEEQTAWINNEALWDTVAKKSEISSILLPYGYSLKMYASDGFVEREGVEVLNGPLWATGEEEMQCINLWQLGDGYLDWDDRIRSFAVYRTDYGRTATGQWHAITTTESISYKYNIGIVNTNTEETEETSSYKMSLDLKTGLKFKFLSGQAGIERTYYDEIETDATLSMTEDHTVDWFISCTGEPGPTGGVGLWQFLVVAGDGTIATYTNHTVCRYGELYNVAPECPWNACDNGDCSACKDDWDE